MGAVESCYGGSQDAADNLAAMTDVVPQRVAEGHPYNSVVQLTFVRCQNAETWEAAASGFVLKDAQHNHIITAGHAVSRGRDEQLHGPVSKIEMSWHGHLFTIKDPIEGLDYVVHPQWRASPDGGYPRKFDIACLQFLQPSLSGRFLSDIVRGMEGGLELSQVSARAGSECRIIGHNNSVVVEAGLVEAGLPWKPGTLYQCLNVLLPRYISGELVLRSLHRGGASGGPWLGVDHGVIAVHSGAIHYISEENDEMVLLASVGAPLTMTVFAQLPEFDVSCSSISFIEE